jgi:hypothetical protein
MVALAAVLVLGAAMAAAAMINYEVNASLLAFAPQNDPAAVSAQNPVAGCDTDEAHIFRGQWPLHYWHRPARFREAAITLLGSKLIAARQAVLARYTREVKDMIRANKALAALVLGLAISALATPGFAQRSKDQMSSARAAALRDCNAKAGKFTQHVWGNHQIDIYRACMAQHGQQE